MNIGSPATISTHPAASGSSRPSYHFDTRIPIGSTVVLVGGSGMPVFPLENNPVCTIVLLSPGVGKTTAVVDIIRGGESCLEKKLDELVVVYTQSQPAYLELTHLIPIVKLVRLDRHLSLDAFLLHLGEKREGIVQGVFFDDVELEKGAGVWDLVLPLATRLAHHRASSSLYTLF